MTIFLMLDLFSGGDILKPGFKYFQGLNNDYNDM